MAHGSQVLVTRGAQACAVCARVTPALECPGEPSDRPLVGRTRKYALADGGVRVWVVAPSVEQVRGK